MGVLRRNLLITDWSLVRPQLGPFIVRSPSPNVHSFPGCSLLALFSGGREFFQPGLPCSGRPGWRNIQLNSHIVPGNAANLLQFSYANVCKHTPTENFVVAASLVGASKPKPFGLTPRPQPSFRLRPSQYRRRLDQAARSSEGLPEGHSDQHYDHDPARTDNTGKRDSDTQRSDP
jgi:hypothetical protein